MGVRGLWRILEPCGRPVSSPEVLAEQRLAIDASIWLYQFMRALPQASSSTFCSLVLAGLFQRLCKLIFYGIKPVIVFDGAASPLKRRTVRERAAQRTAAEERYRRTARKIIAMQLKLSAAKSLHHPQNAERDDFECLEKYEQQETQEEESLWDPFESNLDERLLEDVDVFSKDFGQLPRDLQQEILLAKKEHVLKQHTHLFRENQDCMPAHSFSAAQIDALVKRRKIAAQLEKVREGSLMMEEEDMNVLLGPASRISKRIASDSRKEFVLMKNVKGGWTLDGRVMEDLKKSPKGGDTSGVEEAKMIRQEDDLELFFGSPMGDPEGSTVGNMPEMLALEESPPEALNLPPSKSASSDIIMQKMTSIISGSTTEKSTVNLPISFDPEEYLKTPIGNPPEREESLVDQEKIFDNPKRPPIAIVDVEQERSPSENDLGPSGTLNKDKTHKEDDPVLLEQLQEEEDEWTGIFDELAHANQSTNMSQLIDQLQREIADTKELSRAYQANSASLDAELLEDFKELLRIMGIPWLVAPFEAEAQCVWLQREGFVDGIITDDNDAIVFGGDRIFRHFFHKDKRISMFRRNDLVRELHLNEERLVLMAILMGSDYGVGVKGLGPVKTRELLDYVDKMLPADASLSTRLKVLQEGLCDGRWPACDKLTEGERIKLERIALRCAIADPSIIDVAIANAYGNPHVDETPPLFRWNLLTDLSRLEAFIRPRLHWSSEHLRAILDPIVRKMMDRSRGIEHSAGRKGSYRHT